MSAMAGCRLGQALSGPPASAQPGPERGAFAVVAEQKTIDGKAQQKRPDAAGAEIEGVGHLRFGQARGALAGRSGRQQRQDGGLGAAQRAGRQPFGGHIVVAQYFFHFFGGLH